MPLAGWDSTALAVLEGESVGVAVFFRLDATSGPVRIWIGDFDFPFVADATVELADCIYSGIGDVIGDTLPAISQLTNGQAEKVNFTLSGVSAAILPLALDDAADIAQRAIDIGFCCLDGALQQCTPVAWVAYLEAQTISIARRATQDAAVRSITLAATSLFANRQQPRTSYFGPQDQKQRSPDDTFFDRVPGITEGKTRIFAPTDASGG